MDPGVDHLVAEGAEAGLERQRFEQGPRENDLADTGAIAIQAGAAPHASIAPTHAHQAGPIGAGQGTLEVLAVEAVIQRQQRCEGHAGGAGRLRRILTGPSVRLMGRMYSSRARWTSIRP